MTLESFLEGHMRIFDWLGGVPRECVYDNLRSVVARRERDVVHWNARFLHLRGHYAFHSTACTPATPREKGSVEGAVRHLKSGFWPARRIASLADLDEQYADWRDRVCNRRLHASGRFSVAERLAEERAALRPLPPARFDYAYARASRVPLDGYLRYRQAFYRAPEALVHQRVACTPTATRSGSRSAGAGGRALCAQLRARQLAPACAAAPRAAAGAGARRRSPCPPICAARARRLRGAVRMSARAKAARSASACPTCSPSSRRRACSSASSRPPSGPAPSPGPTSSSSRRCWRPRSSRATPRARASASVTPSSRPERRSRTSTGRPSRAPSARS